MGLDRIVCLANSYKHEHRCVAGISLTTHRWVRLVGQRIPGCLTIDETCYSDGRQAALLDVFEVEISGNCDTNSHPEDVFVTERPWQPIRRFDNPSDSRWLSSYINKGPSILTSYGDRIYSRKLDRTPIRNSLELIRPENLWWWIREEKGKRKNRAIFRVGSVVRTCFDLPVTDPMWLEKLHPKPPGIYPHSHFFEGRPPKTLLTTSLSECFEGFHYKLVAGVVNQLG